MVLTPSTGVFAALAVVTYEIRSLGICKYTSNRHQRLSDTESRPNRKIMAMQLANGKVPNVTTNTRVRNSER